jgi:hypothetical protein
MLFGGSHPLPFQEPGAPTLPLLDELSSSQLYRSVSASQEPLPLKMEDLSGRQSGPRIAGGDDGRCTKAETDRDSGGKSPAGPSGK